MTRLIAQLFWHGWSESEVRRLLSNVSKDALERAIRLVYGGV
jgi:hypothetical protein